MSFNFLIQAKPGLLFVYFHPILNTMTNKVLNLTMHGKSIDGILEIRTRDRRIVGADEYTQLLWPICKLGRKEQILLKKWTIPGLFIYFRLFSTVDSKQVNKCSI